MLTKASWRLKSCEMYTVKAYTEDHEWISYDSETVSLFRLATPKHGSQGPKATMCPLGCSRVLMDIFALCIYRKSEPWALPTMPRKL